MNHLFRILDAGANRCREGLRVVEDYVRFALDDAHLARKLKEVRHDLAAALDLLPAEPLLRSRDTPGDVGRTIQTQAEQQRVDAAHVARANCKRVEEALRTLEEYGKCVDLEFAARCERLRYRFYTIEQVLLNTAAARQRLASCRLYWLFGSTAPASNPAALSSRDAETILRAGISGGVDAVQLREKALPDRQLIDLARRVRNVTRETEVLFIINDRPDIAVLVNADGVHVGQDDMSVREARSIVGPDRLVGVSTHTIEQARQAVLDGADYLGVGPTFPSQTKQFENFAGLEFIRTVAAEITLPWFAIGGVNESNVADVRAAGATRIAVSAAITTADDPAAAAARLKSQLRDAHSRKTATG